MRDFTMRETNLNAREEENDNKYKNNNYQNYNIVILRDLYICIR